MVKRIQQLVLLGALAFVVYFLLSHHIVFFGKDIELLNKSNLTLNNTFVSPGDEKQIRYKGLENVLEDDLREAGLGPLLVEHGLVTQEELDKAEEKIDARQ